MILRTRPLSMLVFILMLIAACGAAFAQIAGVVTVKPTSKSFGPGTGPKIGLEEAGGVLGAG